MSEARDVDFAGLYGRLMRVNFLARVKSQISNKTTPKEAASLVQATRDLLPSVFRSRYAAPLEDNLKSVFQRVNSPQFDVVTIEALTGAVYQHAEEASLPALRRFLAVISNMYRSFLDATKRESLDIELTTTIPPLAVFQSDGSSGPFTITEEVIARLSGGSVGVVSLPRSFAEHPIFYGSLAHETGGHDVIHADPTLLRELRGAAHDLFVGSNAHGLSLLWDYWMDEAASDVYGVMNIGPSFGLNLALLLAAFIAQAQRRDRTAPPSLRTSSGPDDRGILDSHPTDILRLSLVQGAVESLAALSSSTRTAYVNRLTELGHALGGDVQEVRLTGFARVPSGESMSFDGSLPVAVLQESARRVGAMIATARLTALGGASIQDIETWDDADENAAVTMAGRLGTGSSIIGLGDDAQILAATTLAALQRPAHYDRISDLANKALDDSFATDPYWGNAARDLLFLNAARTSVEHEVEVDPYAAAVIDYNPLEEDLGRAGMLDVATVQRHAITPIPWPDGGAPRPQSHFVFKGPDAELPRADAVLFTWTNAEANAMAAVLTPGLWAAPPSGYKGPSWHEYTNQWSARFAGRSTARGPASTNHYIGKYMPVVIGTRRVLLFKSNFHLARDDRSVPVKDMFKQVLEQTQARLAITTGTAGAIGAKLELGDVVVTNAALFKCDGTFKAAAFNGKSYVGPYVPTVSMSMKLVNDKLVAPNAKPLQDSDFPPKRQKPRVFLPDTIGDTGEPAVIVTTDMFEYDDAANKFHLQGLGAMVEMDDAMLGLACEELGGNVAWVAVRNASDPQIPKGVTKGAAADTYARYGYWTSIPSVLASWAIVRDFTD